MTKRKQVSSSKKHDDTSSPRQIWYRPPGMKVGRTSNGRQMLMLAHLFRAGPDGIIDPLQGPGRQEAYDLLSRHQIVWLVNVGVLRCEDGKVEITHKGVKKLSSTGLKVRSRKHSAAREEQRLARRKRKQEGQSAGTADAE